MTLNSLLNAYAMSQGLLFRPFAPLHIAVAASDDTHRLVPLAFLALLECGPLSQPPDISAPSLFALLPVSAASLPASLSARVGIGHAPPVLPTAIASRPASLTTSTSLLVQCSRTVPESTIRSSL